MDNDNTLFDSDNNTKYKDGVNRNARLIVRNVSFKATEESLKEHFSKFGSVEEVKLLKKPDGKLVGCAFIHYTHVPMAQKAISATHSKPFLGRPIYVSFAVPKNKYSNEEENINTKPKKEKRHAVSKDEFETPDFIEVPSEQKSKEEKKTQKINRNARLIIRNVSFKATEETLKQHFDPYGEVQEVKLLKKPDGKLVGCAFVHFKNVPMAKKALLSTNMKPFLGRPISVDWAVAKNKYMQHVVSQQIEMEDKVKKEESDSDDEIPMNISNDDVKAEVKSESESGSDDESGSDKGSDSDGKSDDESGSESDDEQESEDEGDDKSVTSTQPDIQRRNLNDAEDGCTVFLTNIPFSVDNDQLRTFAETTGPVKYALVCVDKLTEHSKGTGFIKFVNKDDAEKFLALTGDQLKLEGQLMQAKPALKRENLQKASKKQPKDNRNLYLVKEGVVVAGTKAAVGVSASDMAKRLTLERSKTQMLKNLNRFVSRYRVVVSNLPSHVDDGKLRRLCTGAAPTAATITEARVMRDLRALVGRDGKHPSKGYGFVTFTRHEDALACLRKLNNNPDIFDKNNRPIVSFSIEDRTALNARKKRLEKSIANNPLAKNTNGETNERTNRKRKHEHPDESYIKKRRFEKQERQNAVGRFVRPPTDDAEEFTGLTAKQGSQHKMRTNHKLKMQANIHRQNVKMEKKKSKRTLKLKMAARERIKQPKQKINKNPQKRNKKRKFNHDLL